MIGLLQRVVELAKSFRSGIRKYDRLLLVFGLAIFAGGCFISLQRLELGWSDIDPLALLVLALVLAPLGLVYGAINMMVTSRAAKAPMSFPSSFATTAVAQAAEILPLPGGAIVRGAALVSRGASPLHASGHVIANAVMWIGCAAVAAGLALISAGWPAVAFAAFGGLLTAASYGWIASSSNHAIALLSLIIRLVGLAISALRIFVAFSALALAVSPSEAFVFSFASIAGSASSIAPGGLGVSEAFAALLSTVTDSAPSAAFVAVALNRVVGLTVSGIFAALAIRNRKTEANNG